MSRPDAPLPPDEGRTFPAPWAARAFALAVALHERGVFPWSEWTATLGGAIAATPEAEDGDPDAYWRAWLAALEQLVAAKGLGRPDDLAALQEAWRRAAEATPHGQPIELPGRG